ncbi:hypothetical protein [Kitasatospora sp. NPDC001132]
MTAGRNVGVGWLVRVAAPVVLLALATGCGGGGGSSSGTTPASTQSTAETPAPTASSGSNPSPNAIATLFPGSNGAPAVTKAQLPATQLGGHTVEPVVLAGRPSTPESGTAAASASAAGTTAAAAASAAGTTIGAVHLSAGSFSVADNPCTGRTLHSGDTCTLTVAFRPTTVGTQSAELTVYTTADAVYRVELVGEGLEPSLSPSPSENSPTHESTSSAASPPAVSPRATSPAATSPHATSPSAVATES